VSGIRLLAAPGVMESIEHWEHCLTLRDIFRVFGEDAHGLNPYAYLRDVMY